MKEEISYEVGNTKTSEDRPAVLALNRRTMIADGASRWFPLYSRYDIRTSKY